MRNSYGLTGMLLALALALPSTSQAQCVAGGDETTVRPIASYFPQQPVTVLVNGQPLGYRAWRRS